MVVGLLVRAVPKAASIALAAALEAVGAHLEEPRPRRADAVTTSRAARAGVCLRGMGRGRALILRRAALEAVRANLVVPRPRRALGALRDCGGGAVPQRAGIRGAASAEAVGAGLEETRPGSAEGWVRPCDRAARLGCGAFVLGGAALETVGADLVVAGSRRANGRVGAGVRGVGRRRATGGAVAYCAGVSGAAALVTARAGLVVACAGSANGRIGPLQCRGGEGGGHEAEEEDDGGRLHFDGEANFVDAEVLMGESRNRVALILIRSQKVVVA